MAVAWAADVSPEEAARNVWQNGFPATERGLVEDGLAFFTYHLRPDPPRNSAPPTSVTELLDQGWIRADPVVYEDFLPRSAAGIFQSNLTGGGTRDNSREATRYDLDWLAGAIGRDIHDPFALYERQQNASIAEIAKALDVTVVLH
jgi:uncharacterized glyoxalase superfamily metalloenzyme YdcJ